MQIAKNPTIGPSDARTASITASDATSSRTTLITVSRDPTSALKTYSDGSVTTSVSRNSAGTLSMLAGTCMYEPLPLPVSANSPMHSPYASPSASITTASPKIGMSNLPSRSRVGLVVSPRRMRSSCFTHDQKEKAAAVMSRPPK